MTPKTLTHMAKAYGKMGQIEKGIAITEEAQKAMDISDEFWYRSENYRVKAELMMMREGADRESEKYFFDAIKTARQQQARLFELRATVGLCRLYKKQGKIEEARGMLQEIYGWFTEGFDTKDLQDAKELLDELLSDG